MTRHVATRLAATATTLLGVVVSAACTTGHRPTTVPPAVPQETTDAATEAPGWHSLHSESGERYRFARNMTGLVHQGEMYLSFYEHISGRSRVFVKRWSTHGWVDIPLPPVVAEQPTNAQTLRSHGGSLYLSLRVLGIPDEHAWHIYRLNAGRWEPVGTPVVYRNFKYGILASDFAFSPAGEVYRVWSGDRTVKLESLAGSRWKPAVELPHSAGFLKILFDSTGQLILGVGDPGGRPGVKVKALKSGVLEDMSQGLQYSGYSERYHLVQDGDDLYLAFRVDTPSRGFRVYRRVGSAWTPVGRLPVSYSDRGDSGDSFGFAIHRGKPTLSYRESGMNFIPMVLQYTESSDWHPVGRPGFFSHNVMTPRLLVFQDRLHLFFSWRDAGSGKTQLETFQLRE